MRALAGGERPEMEDIPRDLAGGKEDIARSDACYLRSISGEEENVQRDRAGQVCATSISDAGGVG